MPELKCEICEKSDELIKTFDKWLMGATMTICYRCFSLWYDGITDTKIIKEQSLKGNYYYKQDEQDETD